MCPRPAGSGVEQVLFLEAGVLQSVCVLLMRLGTWFDRFSSSSYTNTAEKIVPSLTSLGTVAFLHHPKFLDDLPRDIPPTHTHKLSWTFFESGDHLVP